MISNPLSMGNVGDLSGVDELLLSAVINFVIAGQELLQLGLHVVVVDGGSFTLVCHGSAVIAVDRSKCLCKIMSLKERELICGHS